MNIRNAGSIIHYSPVAVRYVSIVKEKAYPCGDKRNTKYNDFQYNISEPTDFFQHCFTVICFQHIWTYLYPVILNS